MNLKSGLKYSIWGARKPLAIYYFVVAIILITSIISIMIKGYSGGNIAGIEMSSIIFIFIVGLCSFKEEFRMFLQNGLSRRTLFTSFVSAILLVSAFMAIVDTLLGIITNSFVDYYSLHFQIYRPRYIDASNDIKMFLEGLLWYFTTYLSVAMVGYFITTLFYRMNKGLKLLVSIGTPIFFVIVLPFIEANITDGKITKTIFECIGFMTGVTEGYNPYYSIVSSIIIATLFAGLSYLIIRRATVKDQ